MFNGDARALILDILADFEATKIKDSRIFLAEESIAIMVWGDEWDRRGFELECALAVLRNNGFIKKEHKCGVPRWKLIRRDITE